jgi:hypothetical protein
MKKSKLVLAAALAASLGLAGTAAATPGNGHGGGKGRPGAARADLTNTGVDADALCRVDVKHFPAVGHRAERSWLRFKVRNMDANASFSLWMDDPATVGDATLVQVTDVTITSNDDGGANLRIDTKHGGVLPFGSTLAGLAGLPLEVRNGAGAAVFTGSLPAVQ